MTTAPSGKMRISVSKASSFVRSNSFSLTLLSPGSHCHFDYATLQANDKMLGDNLNQFAEFSFDGQKERKFDAMKVVKPCVPGLWSLRLC